MRYFRGSTPSPHVPPSTLALRPLDRPAMTRGQCGSLRLHCLRLSLDTPCRLIPALLPCYSTWPAWPIFPLLFQALCGLLLRRVCSAIGASAGPVWGPSCAPIQWNSGSRAHDSRGRRFTRHANWACTDHGGWRDMNESILPACMASRLVLHLSAWKEGV